MMFVEKMCFLTLPTIKANFTVMKKLYLFKIKLLVNMKNDSFNN